MRVWMNSRLIWQIILLLGLCEGAGFFAIALSSGCLIRFLGYLMRKKLKSITDTDREVCYMIPC